MLGNPNVILIATLGIAGVVVLTVIILVLRTITKPQDVERPVSQYSIIPEARRLRLDDARHRHATRDIALAERPDDLRPSPSTRPHETTIKPLPGLPRTDEPDAVHWDVGRPVDDAIRVIRPSGGRVRFEVGEQSYASLDAIPDERARELARAALQKLRERRGETAKSDIGDRIIKELEEAIIPDWLQDLSGQAAPAKKATQPTSFVEQIEEMLQRHLAHRPEFVRRSVHVHQVPQGIAIEVDGRYFQGIDEVDDPEVRELIRRVIKEWEGRA